MNQYEKAIEKLLCYLSLFLPLYTLGFRLMGYDFSIAMLIMMIISAVIMVKGKLNGYTAALLYSFICWCLVVTYWRVDIAVYLPSLVALTIVTLPFTANWENISVDKNRIYTWFKYGLYISLFIVFYEVICIGLGTQPFYEGLNFGIFQRIRVHEFLGINRIKGLTIEPAHFAIYLVYSFIIIDLYEKNEKHQKILKTFILISLLLTFSMVGIILFATYFIGKNILFSSQKVRNFFKLSFKIFLISIPLIYIYSDFLYLMISRFESILLVLESGSYQTTYGSRVNAIFVLADYYSSEGFWKFLIGEGYANYEDWLISNYGTLDRSALARGQLPNIFVPVALSTGFIGLLLYFIFLTGIIKNIALRNKGILILVVIVTHFGFGFVIGYFMWSLILIAVILNR